MRAWLNGRVQAGPPAITVGVSDGREGDTQVLRVEIRGDWTEAADDQLADLLMDMRLLGLRPTIMSAPSQDQADGRTP